MANWTTLKKAIASVIKTNGNQEITGAVLQSTLNSIVNAVGENATFAGVATTTTSPGTPDGPVFYIATTAGSYSNFGNIEISKGESAILKWDNGTWAKNTFKPMTDFNSVYDLDGNNLTKTVERLHTDAKIVLASMGTAVDNEGNDSDVAIGYVPSVGDRYYDTSTGHIKWVKSSTVTEDLGLPSEDRIYCNGMTKRLYLFKNGWEKVDKTDITQSTGTSTTAVMSQKAVSDKLSEVDGKVDELEKEVIYDVTANNDGITFDSLSVLLSSENLSTLIPSTVRHGGMSIRFVQSSNNKYIQARLMADSFTTDVTQWQGITNEIIVGSKDVIESGAVAGIIGNLHGALILATSGIGKIIDGINFSNNEPFKFKLSGTSSATRITLRGNGGDYPHPNIQDNITLDTWYNVTAKENTTSLWLWADRAINVTIEVLSKLYNELRSNTDNVAALTPRVQTLEDTQNLMLEKQYRLKYVGTYQGVGTGYQNGDKLYITTGWERIVEVTNSETFPASGSYKFLTLYADAVYIYNNGYYSWNGTTLVKSTAITDTNVSNNTANISILKDSEVYIKHFIPQGGSVNDYNDLEIGDYLYYSNTNTLIQIRALPFDGTSSTYRVVSLYENGTYKYNGSIYVYNGSSLVKSSAYRDDIIVKSTSTNLFNPAKAKENHWVKPNGTEGNDSQYTATDYIPVSVGDVLFGADKKLKENETKPKLVWVAAYDANKSIVEASGATNPANSEYTVPSGIAYVRMTFVKTSVQRPEFRINVDTVKRYEDFFNGNAPLWGYDLKHLLGNILAEPYSTFLPDVVNNLSYKRIGKFEHSYICLTCDDGAHGLATYTIPMVIDKGVPCTFAIMSDSQVFHNGYEEEAASVIDAVQNNGCSIAQHGADVWTQMPEWRLREFYGIQKDFWDSLGVTVKSAVCPQHSNNAIVRAVAGGIFGVVRTGYYYGGNVYRKHPFSNVNKDGWGMNGPTSNLYALSSVAVEDLTLQEHKDNIDYAVANNLLYVIHWHEAWMTNEHKQLLENVIDYAKTTDIVFKNLEDVPNLI